MKEEKIISVNRRGSDCVKWGFFGEDVLPLWVADTDFSAPQAVIEALRNRVEHGVLGYPLDPSGLSELVAERMLEQYHWKVSPKEMIFVPGVVPGFNLTCQAIVQPGESLLVQSPVYPPILKAAKHAGARSIEAQLVRQEDGSYEVDFDALEEMIEADTRCLLLCNPQNPVGKVFLPEELHKLAEICLRHKMPICSDEIHSDLVFSGSRHVPVASLSTEIAENTVTLISPSKTFNIAGLECAVLICQNPELMRKIQHARRGLLGGVNVLGLTAAEAAYRHGAGWLINMMQLLEENRDYLAYFLQTRIPEIKMHSPDATYLAWLNCRELGLKESPFNFFLNEAKVALNRGEEFGAGGEGFVRLNFGCTRETLDQALERIKKAVRAK